MKQHLNMHNTRLGVLLLAKAATIVTVSQLCKLAILSLHKTQTLTAIKPNIEVYGGWTIIIPQQEIFHLSLPRRALASSANSLAGILRQAGANGAVTGEAGQRVQVMPRWSANWHPPAGFAPRFAPHTSSRHPCQPECPN